MSWLDWLNIIVAVLLFLISIRSIVVDYSRADKSPYKLIRILFAKNEEITADRILEKLGYSPSEKDLFRRNAKKMQSNEMLEGIVGILAKATIKSSTEDQVSFGSSHSSSYYVDTMGIAHDEFTCKEMNKFLWQLIRKKGLTNIDYVFSLKDSNTCLASSFDKGYDKIFSIIAKTPDSDKSYARGVNHQMSAYINFEGFQVLQDRAKNSHALRGIAIACNLSNGSSMLTRILDFNATIKALTDGGHLSPSVKPIDKVFVLYRAVDDPKLDKNFEDEGITCYRFFDLNEARKAELFEIKNGDKNSSNFSCIECIKHHNVKECNAKHCWKKL